MLKITVSTDESGSMMRLEGRLAGSAIMEAERCWQAMRVEHPEKSPQIDLRAVTFIDREGKSFLKHAFQQGARFLSSGCLTRAYVDEVMCSDKEGAERKA